MSAMVRDGRIASNGGHQLQSEHTGWRGKRVDLVLTGFVAAHAKVTIAEVFDNGHPLNVLYTFLSGIWAKSCQECFGVIPESVGSPGCQ